MADASSSLQNSYIGLSDSESGSEPDSNSHNMPHSDQFSPLQPLKAIVLSLDWEISDNTISSFLLEVQRLNTIMQGDAVVQKFLQLLDSLGKYVFRRKNMVHPDSIRLLHSAYESLEQVLLNPDMDEAARRSLLFHQLAEYRKLKEKVSPQPDDQASKPVSETTISEGESDSGSKLKAPVPIPDMPEEKSGSAKPETMLPPAAPPLHPHEAFSLALDEIKYMIQAEFRAIRAEIHLWRMEK
ncbi:MAG: hypothetical protein AB7S77_08575 [Desulfatirhabdiaceae bacterium]